jgi:uncharacterized cupredoxin-like copper-binding protein
MDQFTRNLIRIGTVAATSLAVVGCGSGNNGSSGGSSASSSQSTAPAQSTTTAKSSAPAASGGHKLSLSADGGGAIKFDKTSLDAKAGKVTITMTNPSSSGTMHGVAVEGKGVDKDGPIVAPGSTSTVTVNLKPGTYEFYCPYDGHKGEGMEGKLVVS